MSNQPPSHLHTINKDLWGISRRFGGGGWVGGGCGLGSVGGGAVSALIQFKEQIILLFSIQTVTRVVPGHTVDAPPNTDTWKVLPDPLLFTAALISLHRRPTRTRADSSNRPAEPLPVGEHLNLVSTSVHQSSWT